MKTALLSLLIIALFINQKMYAQAGAPDKSFGENGLAKIYVPFKNGDYNVLPFGIVQRKDGKYMVAVTTSSSQGNSGYLYRLFYNGNVDSTFGKDGKITLYAERKYYGRFIFNLAIDSNDNILVTTDDGLRDAVFKLVRYTPYGSLDKTFGDSGIVTVQHGGFLYPIYRTLTLLPGGKILLSAGVAKNYYSDLHSIIFRYNQNGTPDSSFNEKGFLELNDFNYQSAHTLAAQQEGTFLFGNEKIHRINNDGSLNFNFGNGGVINGDLLNNFHEVFSDIQVLSGGKIVCKGYLQNYNTTIDKLYRFKKNGKPDTSFNGTGELLLDM